MGMRFAYQTRGLKSKVQGTLENALHLSIYIQTVLILTNQRQVDVIVKRLTSDDQTINQCCTLACRID